MEWQVILALVLGVPLMVATYVYLWYSIISGINAAIKEARERRAARETREAQTVGAKR
jgi:hypothetical protein